MGFEGGQRRISKKKPTALARRPRLSGTQGSRRSAWQFSRPCWSQAADAATAAGATLAGAVTAPPARRQPAGFYRDGKGAPARVVVRRRKGKVPRCAKNAARGAGAECALPRLLAQFEFRRCA